MTLHNSIVSTESIDMNSSTASSIMPGQNISGSPELERELWSRCVAWPKGNDTWFLPKDSFNSLITERSINRELCGHHKPDSSSEILLAARRHHNIASNLFALLALVDKATFIIGFVDGDRLSDLNLPFVRSLGTGSALDIKLHSVLQEEKVINALQSWSSRDMRQLNSIQWTVLVPFFDIDNLRLPNITYPDNTIFPFEDDQVKNARNPSGAHGTIWKVRIHPANHNFPDSRNNVRSHRVIRHKPILTSRTAICY
jgi:hypothetical protein